MRSASNPLNDIYDVAIVGYGPTGALAANLLGARGHRVIVLDKEIAIYPLPRAIHLDAEIMRVYQAVGLTDEIAPIMVPLHECQFVTADRRLLFKERSDPKRTPYGWPGRLLYRQPQLEEKLRAGVERFPNVSVKLGQGVKAFWQDVQGVTLLLQDDTQIQAKYVLGCDGAHSVMRQLSSIVYTPMAKFKQPWLVVDGTLSGPSEQLPQVMLQVCDPLRPTTYVPRVGTGEYRWEFYLHPEEDPAEMQRPERLNELLRPWVNPDNLTLERSAVYTFRALVAERWRSGRVLLVGDAAHLTPPFMGQGLGAGARDAHNIAWKIDLVLRGRADDVLLNSYQREREPHVRFVTRLAITAGRVIMEERASVQRWRDALLTRLARLPWLSRETPLPGLWRGVFHRSSGAGSRFLQPQITHSGRPKKLDDALGDGFAILAWNTSPRHTLEMGMDFYWESLNTRFIQVVPAGEPEPKEIPPGVEVIQDDSGELERWFRKHHAQTVILRPDRYVFGSFKKDSRVTSSLRAALRDEKQANPEGNWMNWLLSAGLMADEHPPLQRKRNGNTNRKI